VSGDDWKLSLEVSRDNTNELRKIPSVDDNLTRSGNIEFLLDPMAVGRHDG
jgi:hypothetical protein